MRGLSPEVEALVERSAAVPRGLAFLHRAPLDTVAVALGARPVAVEEARAALDRREHRAALLRRFVAAGRAPRGAARPGGPTPAAAPPDPGELVRLAERHELGSAFLRKAPLEVVAIAFGVHPDLVARARALAAGSPAPAEPAAPTGPQPELTGPPAPRPAAAPR